MNGITDIRQPVKKNELRKDDQLSELKCSSDLQSRGENAVFLCFSVSVLVHFYVLLGRFGPVVFGMHGIYLNAAVFFRLLQEEQQGTTHG